MRITISIAGYTIRNRQRNKDKKEEENCKNKANLTPRGRLGGHQNVGPIAGHHSHNIVNNVVLLANAQKFSKVFVTCPTFSFSNNFPICYSCSLFSLAFLAP